MKFLFVIFLLPLQLFAQDITGVWTGTLYIDTPKQVIKYELAISEYNGKLSGYSHTIFVIDGIKNTGLKSVTIKKAGEEFLVEDDKLIFNNYTTPPAKGVKTHSRLVLLQNDTALVLSGPWNTNRTRIYTKLTGNVFLQKKKKMNETLIMARLENLGLARSLSFIASLPQANDPVIINNPGEPRHPVEITQDVIPGKNGDINANNQQDSQQARTDKHVPGAVLSKDSAANVKPRQKTLPLPVAGTPVQKNGIKDATPPGKISAKPGSRPIDKQPEESNNIAGRKLKKDSSRETGSIKQALSQPAAGIATRKIEAIKSVDIKSDSLLLTLYDNGEIDGDTVSVLLNGEVIMPMQGLTVKAINKTIYLTPEMSDSIVLIMYAENLGSIPPNTGLLVIHDGDETYQIRFTGDLEKNSSIILKRRKKIN